MMELSSTGRFASTIKRTLRGCSAGLLLAAGVAQGAPASYGEGELAAALAVAEGAWADSLLQLDTSAQERDALSYDEQIFTELSPILDSPDAIKLPEDQLLTD